MAYNKAYYEKNKDKILSNAKVRRKKNPDDIRAVERKSYSKHKESQLKRQKVKYQKYREKDLARQKRYKKKCIENGTSMRGWLTKKFEGIPCMDCDGVFKYCAMDFDHRPGEIKEFIISSFGHYKATPERVAKWMKEISKCDLICSNCHRVRTVERRS